MTKAQKISSINYIESTHDTTLFTSLEEVSKIEGHSNVILKACAAKEHHIISLYFQILDYHRRPFSLSEGVKVIFTMTDYSTMYIPNINSQAAAREGDPGYRNWTANAIVDLEQGNIDKMLSMSIRTISIQADNKSFDFNLSIKQSDVVKKMLQLAIAGESK